MRSAWHKYFLCLTALAGIFGLCMTAQAQTNPHTGIRWPAPSCQQDVTMVYNYVSNTCFSAVVGPKVDPSSAINWPANCNSSNFMTYNVLSNSCFSGAVVIAAGTTTTLAPGSSATVTQTGTFPNYILNFGIPAGVPGGSLSYPGVITDGNQGLSVTGAVSTASAKVGYKGITYADGSTQTTGAQVFSTKSGVMCWGDSIVSGTGLPSGLGWCPQLASIANAAQINKGFGGTVTSDAAAEVLGWQEANGIPLPLDHNNPVSFLEIGTNVAGANNNPSAAVLLAEVQSIVATGLTMGTSANDKFWAASAWTTTGTWTQINPWMAAQIWPVAQSGYTVGDTLTVIEAGSCNCGTVQVDTTDGTGAVTRYHWVLNGSGYTHAIATTTGGTGTGFQLNIAYQCAECSSMQNSASGDTITTPSLSIGPSGAVAIVFGAFTSGSGTFQVTLDGGSTPLTDIVTGTSNISSIYQGAGRVGFGDTGGITPIPVIFTGIAQGAHTFKITATNSGKVIPVYAVVPSAIGIGAGDGPNLIISSVVPEQGNVFNVSSCKLSNQHQTAVQILNSIGIYGVGFFDGDGWSDPNCGAGTNPTKMDVNRDFASTATANISITNSAVASNGIATLTGTNTLSAGNQVYVSGLNNAALINNTPVTSYTVLASGLSGGQFQVQTPLTTAITSAAESGATAALMSANVVLNTAAPKHPSSSGQVKWAQGFARTAGLQSGSSGSSPINISSTLVAGRSSPPIFGHSDPTNAWVTGCASSPYGTIFGACESTSYLGHPFSYFFGSTERFYIDYFGNLKMNGDIASGTAHIPTITATAGLLLQNGANSGLEFSLKAGQSVTQTEYIRWYDFNASTLLWTLGMAANKDLQVVDAAGVRRAYWQSAGISYIGSSGTSDVQINSMANMGSGGLSIYSGGASPTKVASIDSSGNISAGAGTNVVLRCTTAGTLPVGALTTVAGNCGASTDTGLRVK